jgi:hypothetical protein
MLERPGLSERQRLVSNATAEGEKERRKAKRLSQVDR